MEFLQAQSISDHSPVELPYGERDHDLAPQPDAQARGAAIPDYLDVRPQSPVAGNPTLCLFQGSGLSIPPSARSCVGDLIPDKRV